MKRVQLQLPDAVVAWIDHHAEGVESRASFVRRTLVAAMRSERQQGGRAGLPRPALPPLDPPRI